MAKLIQSQARALLALLTSKDGGLGPPAMEDYLRLTLDTQDFYGMNSRQLRIQDRSAAQLDTNNTGWIGAGAANVFGWFPTVSENSAYAAADVFVPEGEIWRVLGVSMTAFVVTASITALAAGWAHGSSAGGVQAFAYVPIGAQAPVSIASGGVTSGGPCDFLALPRSAPAFFVNNWQLGVDDFDLRVNVVYERLPL